MLICRHDCFFDLRQFCFVSAKVSWTMLDVHMCSSVQTGVRCAPYCTKRAAWMSTGSLQVVNDIVYVTVASDILQVATVSLLWRPVDSSPSPPSCDWSDKYNCRKRETKLYSARGFYFFGVRLNWRILRLVRCQGHPSRVTCTQRCPVYCFCGRISRILMQLKWRTTWICDTKSCIARRKLYELNFIGHHQ